MAKLGITHDATNGETMDAVIPAGEYTAVICKSEVKNSKANPQNSYANLEFEVTDGRHKNRRFWTMLNLWNDNPETVGYARRELNSICHAIGKLRVSDTDELHGIPMVVKLVIRKDDKYGDQNSVKEYKPLNGVPAVQSNNAARSTSPPATAPPPQSTQDSSEAPWDRL